MFQEAVFVLVLIQPILMLKEKIDGLKRKVKYFTKADFDEVLLVTEEKKNDLRNLDRFITEKTEFKSNGLLVRFAMGDSMICVKMFVNSDFPAVRSVNESKDKKYDNLCDLFIGETIKLSIP